MATPKVEVQYQTLVKKYVELCGITADAVEDHRRLYDASKPDKYIGIHVQVTDKEKLNNLIANLQSDVLKFRITDRAGWTEIQAPEYQLSAAVKKRQEEVLSNAFAYINAKNNTQKSRYLYVNTDDYPLDDEIRNSGNISLIECFGKGGILNIDMGYSTINDNNTVTIQLPTVYSGRDIFTIDVAMSKLIKFAELQKSEKKEVPDPNRRKHSAS